jgi:ferritin-like metal-binding protein YciE
VSEQDRRHGADPFPSPTPRDAIAARRVLAMSRSHTKGEPVMAETGTLHDAFLDELRDMYDAEKQLTKALPALARAATSPDLRAAFESHLEETKGHVERLTQVFQSLDERASGKHCDGIAGIIEEGKSVMEEDFEGSTMDACLIAGGQRAEHYEMAAYGTLIAWAKAMGHEQAVDLLEENLEEEKAADKKLTTLADGGINQEAANEAHPDDEEDVAPRARAGSSGAGSRGSSTAMDRRPRRKSSKTR